MSNLIETITQEQLRSDLPDFGVGDTIAVHAKVVEGTRERIQIFEGTVISRKNGNKISANFTVRRIASGVGVERTFMLNSPKIVKIVVVRTGFVRRAKLYYLRDRVGKAAKVRQKL